MDRDELKLQIDSLVKKLLVSEGFVLVEFVFRQDGLSFFLGLFVDRPEGRISLGECSLLNRKVRQVLDENKIFSGQYTLEVSSPGLDRPLKTKEDFIRCLNKEVVFFLNDFLESKCQWQGLLSRVDESSVIINSGEHVLEIPLIKINKAKLIIK